MTSVVVGLVVGVLVLNGVLGVVNRKSLFARLDGDEAQRVRVFRNTIAGAWALAAIAALIVVAPADELRPSDVGWTWPANAALTALLAVLALGMSIGSAAQIRRHMRAGRPSPLPPELTVLLPRTPRERRLVAGLAVTAGVTEEVVYRGFLIGAVIAVFGAPPLLAAALSLLLFVAAHAYQGRQGLVGASAAGLLLTLLYLVSGSILPGIVVHAVQDLVSLLTVPAAATPAEDPAAQD
ncbi:MAG: CPBP family intramembrane glutamic endopeptidase [Actinoplanes sp.]